MANSSSITWENQTQIPALRPHGYVPKSRRFEHCHRESMMPETFKPTAKMAANAKKGLKLRDDFGRGGTDVGVRRAEQLAAQDDVTAEDMKSMHSYFARHEVDKDGKTHEWGSDSDPSAGYIAWLLWGGDEGKEWADRHVEKFD
jgi:hypothetical protein